MNTVAHLLAAVFVPLFLAGMVGSVAVVVLTVVSDLQQVFRSDEAQDAPDL